MGIEANTAAPNLLYVSALDLGCGTWDPYLALGSSSLTRDRTLAPKLGAWSLSH